MHLLLQAPRRDALHRLLRGLPAYAAGLPGVRRVRWSLAGEGRAAVAEAA